MAAARRLATSVVDWAAFGERVPPAQKEYFRALKAKSDSFVNSVHQGPEKLPSIDFASYRGRLANPALVDQFEKAYAGVSVPYPKDNENLLDVVKQQQKQAEEATKRYMADLQTTVVDAKEMIAILDKLPKAEEMTIEMYYRYFPDKALDPVNRPTFWPHVKSIQPGGKIYKKY